MIRWVLLKMVLYYYSQARFIRFFCCICLFHFRFPLQILFHFLIVCLSVSPITLENNTKMHTKRSFKVLIVLLFLSLNCNTLKNLKTKWFSTVKLYTCIFMYWVLCGHLRDRGPNRYECKLNLGRHKLQVRCACAFRA